MWFYKRLETFLLRMLGWLHATQASDPLLTHVQSWCDELTDYKLGHGKSKHVSSEQKGGCREFALARNLPCLSFVTVQARCATGERRRKRRPTETSRMANVREVDSMQPGSDLHGAAFLAGHRLGGATKLSDTCEAFCKDITAEKIGVIENFIYFIRHVQKSPTKRAMHVVFEWQKHCSGWKIPVLPQFIARCKISLSLSQTVFRLVNSPAEGCSIWRSGGL